MRNMVRNKTGVCKLVVIILVIGAVIYSFSLGPSYRLMRENKISNSIFKKIYYPFMWLERHNKYADQVIGWYERLWYSDQKEIMRYLQQLKLESSSTNPHSAHQP